MTMRPIWQRIGERHWHEIRGQWLPYMSHFGATVSKPDPGLDRLATLQVLKGFEDGGLIADVEGLRSNLLAEAVFLYHKASHAQLAVARLSKLGMSSWAMFNAYHSALLSGKAAMSLLGVGFPKISGADVMIDVFPALEKRPTSKRSFAAPSHFVEFRCSRLKGQLQQRYVWEALQRVVRMTKGAWDGMTIPKQLDSLDWEQITPPRNKFIYQPYYWPDIDDLDHDVEVGDWATRIGVELDTDSGAFLVRLSLAMHSLVAWLMEDLADNSNRMRMQIDLSRWPSSAEAKEWSALQAFQAGAA